VKGSCCDVTCCLLLSVYQILKTLKLLPIGNKTVLRDSRILSVVEKWSNEILSGGEHLTEVSATGAAETTDVTANAESTDVAEDVEEMDSGTEAKEANDGSEVTENRQMESISRNDVEVPQPVVSNRRLVF